MNPFTLKTNLSRVYIRNLHYLITFIIEINGKTEKFRFFSSKSILGIFHLYKWKHAAISIVEVAQIVVIFMKKN